MENVIFRWCSANRSRLCKGPKSIRPRSRGLQVRSRRPGRAGTELSQGVVPGDRADLPECSAATRTHETAGATFEEAWKQCLSVLFRTAAALSGLGDAAAGARRHRQTMRSRL